METWSALINFTSSQLDGVVQVDVGVQQAEGVDLQVPSALCQAASPAATIPELYSIKAPR